MIKRFDMYRKIFLLLILFACRLTYSQEVTQTVRGRVYDKCTCHFPVLQLELRRGAGISWKVSQKQSVSFAYGKHSLLEPLRIYLMDISPEGKTVLACICNTTVFGNPGWFMIRRAILVPVAAAARHRCEKENQEYNQSKI